MKRIARYKYLLVSSLLLISCGRDYTPKPSGYLRVDYPQKNYRIFSGEAPFTFEYPEYAEIVADNSPNAEPFWYDMQFPSFKGTLHMSYKKIENDNLEPLIADTRSLVYKHVSRAEGINEIPFYDRENSKYGILYALEGDVASTVQFFLTDSTKNFLRASLYFMATPNKDSLNPIIRFVKEDIEHMMETVRWK